MRLRILSILSVMALVLGLASIAAAHHKDSHDQNAHGMCTAYFSGGENGQEKKRENGNAFGVFEEGIGDYDEDGDTDAFDVAAWCNDNTGGFGNPGEGNDPFFSEDDDCEQDDPSAQQECEALADQEGGTDPGNSNGNNGNNGNGGGGS